MADAPRPAGEGLQFHPFADIFPLIEGHELAALVEDVRQNGVRDPIYLLDGRILDGRNRYRALRALRASGEPRGPGWGVYEGEPVGDEDLDPAASLWPFEKYSPAENGDALAFVISKNLHRRHLDDRQRASVAAKIANLRQGGDRTKPPIGGLTTEQAAEMLNVAPRQVERARAVHEHGVEELRGALDRGAVAVSVAEEIARKPEDEQRVEIVRRGIAPINGARAVMASRQEPDDSLDYFPTPPWAVRGLVELVLPRLGVVELGRVWEPACGEGHISGVLQEYAAPGAVIATDIHDYSVAGDRPPGWEGTLDFLGGDEGRPEANWIVTNPPFGEKPLAFALRALELAREGVALFVQLRLLETVERYERLFRDRPPTLCAFHVERVNLCRGRWDPDGSTATAYMWLVWRHGLAPQPPFWIPPICRSRLSRADDRARFTAHPVAGSPPRDRILPPHDPDTGEILETAEAAAGPPGPVPPPAAGAAPELIPVSAGAAPLANVSLLSRERPAFAEEEDDGLDLPDCLRRRHPDCFVHGRAGTEGP